MWRQILLYHILPGRVFFRQLASGQPFATALGGRSVQGELTNGFLTVEGAQADDVDLIASNGVIQVLDRVLVPSDALTSAHVRFAQFSADAPAVDIYINGRISSAQGLGFPSISDWLNPPAAITTIAFVPSGAPLDDAVIIPADFTLRPNTWTTLAAVGSLKQQTLIPVLIPEDAAPIPAGEARITVLDALEGVRLLDFTMDGSVEVSRLGFPFSLGDNDGFYSFDHHSGTYDLGAKNYGDSASFKADLQKSEISAGMHYLVVVAGTPDKPILFLSGDQR